MNAWTALVAALITLPATQALAASVVIQCPERISMEEIAKANYRPWEVTADKGKVDVRLQSMLLYEGHPREMASIMPDKTTEARGLLVATWRLAKAEVDRGYWVGCAYRNSMTLLTKRLPDTVSSCRYTQKIFDQAPWQVSNHSSVNRHIDARSLACMAESCRSERPQH